jgi:hypothetical protein
VHLTKVDHKCVLTRSRRSLGYVGEVFEVMIQDDLGLTIVSGLTQLIWSLALMMLI